jgi:Ulp1 family protease
MILNHLDNCPLADGKILYINITNDIVTIRYQTWDNVIYDFQFKESLSVSDYRSVGNDISHLEVNENPEFIIEIKKKLLIDDMVTETELASSNHYSFISSWGTYSILEIVARKVHVTEII